MEKNKLKFEILNELGVISEGNKGWKKEFNRMSWNGEEAKYDIRSWDSDHSKMGKGITLTEEELRQLSKLILEELKILDEDK